MDNFRCFVVNKKDDTLQPYPCNEIMDNDISIYVMHIGILSILLAFMIFIRPATYYIIQKCFHIKRRNNNTIDGSSDRGTSSVVTENKEVQCNIDMNFHSIVINPDSSLNITENAAM